MASEYLKWKYRDVKPDQPAERTRKQKAANWWHYHRWWLLVAALLIVALLDIGKDVLGIGAVRPDYQLAYVASAPLDDDVLAALEHELAALGEDCDGDGAVVVQAHPYVDMAVSQDSDAAQYTAAAKVKLMADLEACESYFFVCDAPETLHESYDVLARADGELAGASDAVAYYPLSNCPALAGLAAERPELAGLFLARRGFWRDRTCQYKGACDALWDKLTEGAKP